MDNTPKKKKKDWFDLRLENSEKEELEVMSEKIDTRLFGEKEDPSKNELALIGENPEEAQEYIDKWGKFSGLSTGWDSVDDLTYGWNPGELIIMGGEPGVGKSAFMLALAVNIAIQGVMPTVVSLELTPAQIKARIAVNYGPGWDALPIVHQKMQFINRNDFHKIVLNAVKGGSKVIIVDYLQMLKNDSDNEHQEISRIIRELKLLALKHKVVIISISALNRSRALSEGLEMKHLHGSGTIEYYADQVVFLEKGDAKGHVIFKIVKNRSNPIDFDFNATLLSFDGSKFKSIENFSDPFADKK